MPPKKKETKDLISKLALKKMIAWDHFGERDEKQIVSFSQKYIHFLNRAKTEREAIGEILKQAKYSGFNDISGQRNVGNRFYQINRNKNIALCHFGKKDIRQGIRLIVSHIDSPRLDLKPNPLYEDQDLALLRTHYYGGIKKYQWVAIPLALHGVVIRSDGRKIELGIGEDPADPVFTISDLLPHLARKIMETKKIKDAVEGEKLTVLFGHQPISGNKKEKERVKLNILRLLHEKYKITEEDLISAEIEIVPAFKARDVGLDRSMIGGYGQDDRICAYTSMEAIFALKEPQYTSVVLFLDKEEIGSEGNTGAQSRFFEIVVGRLIQKAGLKHEEGLLREILFRSKALSADVNAGLDPNYADVVEKQNASLLGYGVNIGKYTGSGGKYSDSDAGAEYLGEIRRLFNEQKIAWQAKELGKVDEGGGGTVAKFLAVYGMDMIDCGPPVLGMHSPFEVASKADLYETYKAYQVFLAKS